MSMNMTKRNYGIELLRLVFMCMICMLHTLGHGGVLNSCIEGTMQYHVFWFMETLAYCAVDGFAIITGYTAKGTPPRVGKIINMWFQVFFYSLIVPLILAMIGVPVNASMKEWIKMMLPLTYSRYWYFSAYVGLFLTIPVLNKFLFSLDEVTAKKVLLVIFIVFTLGSRLADPFSLIHGYSAIWLMILYSIGVLAKRTHMMEKMKSSVLIVVWLTLILVTWFIRIVIGTGILLNYTSPTILLAGFIMVILFSRIKISGKYIAKIAPMAFGIYLFHDGITVRRLISGQFAFVAEMPVFKGVGYVMLIVASIFVVSLVIESVRRLLEKWLRIPAMSQKIAEWMEFTLNWICNKVIKV